MRDLQTIIEQNDRAVETYQRTLNPNTRRAKAGQTAIAAFIAIPRTETGADDTDLIDLLTNLGHWATAQNVNFDDAIRIAKEHIKIEA